jgi:hypothetical protein
MQESKALFVWTSASAFGAFGIQKQQPKQTTTNRKAIVQSAAAK